MTTSACRQALGAYGEDVAARHLVAEGMVLLDRNWRCAGRARSTWCCATAGSSSCAR